MSDNPLKRWKYRTNGRPCKGFFILIPFTLIFIAGCALPSSSATDTPWSSSKDRINITRVTVTDDVISAMGQITKTKGECIQTQLYANDRPETWWPVRTCADRENGTWVISVSLGMDGAPIQLKSEMQYSLHAWLQGNPSEKDVLYFDLAGPPRPEE